MKSSQKMFGYLIATFVFLLSDLVAIAMTAKTQEAVRSEILIAVISILLGLSFGVILTNIAYQGK